MSGPEEFNVGKFGKVGVFLGGRSRERAISIRSGQAVYLALKRAGCDVRLIDPVEGFQSQLRKDPIDLAFLALHGQGGEDGWIQRILVRLKIPYVGSDPHASALAFDKAKSKYTFRCFGIPTPNYEVVTRKNWRHAIRKWIPPYVIKPVREGSSIGIFFVDRKCDRLRILESLDDYGRLLFEKKIEGREFTVGILGDVALPVIELRTKRKFYDYQAKYTKGLTEYLVPAPIPEELGKRLRRIALHTHRTVGLRDLSRVDFKVDLEGHPYVLEINSIPGFTDTSLLPKAAQQVGIDFDTLCLRLLEMAYERVRIKDRQDGEAQNEELDSQVAAEV